MRKCSKCGVEINPQKYKEYYCRQCKNKYQQEWAKRNPEKVKEYQKRYKTTHRKQTSIYQRKHRKQARRIVIGHYSKGTFRCNCCGESEYKFLCIDHIKGDGKKDRERRRGKGLVGGAYYHYLIKNNFPKGLQVLCYNCNLAKGFYGKCPHKKTNPKSQRRSP